VLRGGIAPAEIHLPYIHRRPHVKRLKLFFGKLARRIQMVDLFALDLAEEIHLRIEMERCRGRSRTDENGGLQPHHIAAKPVRPKLLFHLPEKLRQQVPKSAVMPLQPLKKYLVRTGSQSIERFVRFQVRPRHAIECRPRRRSTVRHEIILRLISEPTAQATQRIVLEQIELVQVVAETERHAIVIAGKSDLLQCEPRFRLMQKH
jgi:hypothetical protein